MGEGGGRGEKREDRAGGKREEGEGEKREGGEEGGGRWGRNEE